MNPPTWYGEAAKQTIQDGCLREYTGQEMSAYCCPKFQRKDVCGWTDAIRSYSMDWYFGFNAAKGPQCRQCRSGQGTTTPLMNPVGFFCSISKALSSS
jgi:hypothetical protein